MIDLNKLKDQLQYDVELGVSTEIDGDVVIGIIEQLEAAEAELARRDAAADEPDGYIFLHPNGKLFWSVTADSNAGQKDIKPFYFAAQPSALPPEVTELTDYQKDNIRFMSKSEAAIQGANWMHGRVKALGCNAIKLPPLSKTDKNFYGVLGEGYEAWLEARTAHAVWNEAIKRCTASLKAQGFTVED